MSSSKSRTSPATTRATITSSESSSGEGSRTGPGAGFGERSGGTDVRSWSGRKGSREKKRVAPASNPSADLRPLFGCYFHDEVVFVAKVEARVIDLKVP